MVARRLFLLIGAFLVLAAAARAAKRLLELHPTPPPMVQVPAGPFTMGSNPGEGRHDEEPKHVVELPSYHIDKYEVTNGHYLEALNWAAGRGLVRLAPATGSDPAVVSTGPGGEELAILAVSTHPDYECRILGRKGRYDLTPGCADYPVVNITWFGAAAYCNWRSGMEGRQPCYDTSTWECNFDGNGYRLPTEAEWEKAARGARDARRYPWGDDFDCGRADAARCLGFIVAAENAGYVDGRSPYGVAQMSGNVWEWCNDIYSSGAYRMCGSPCVDPRGPRLGSRRVMRGGAWYSTTDLRCAARAGVYLRPFGAYDVGIRCVRRP